MSPAAGLIRVENRGLENFLAVNNTTFKIFRAPILLKHALVGCFVQSGSCNNTHYYSIGIGSEYIIISVHVHVCIYVHAHVGMQWYHDTN